MANAIRDDDFRDWHQRILETGASVVFIFDSCHAGTMVRGNGMEAPRAVPAQLLVPQHIREQIGLVGRPDRDPAPFGSPGADQHGRWVALYAAQPNQLTWERRFPLDGAVDHQQTHGWLTYIMCEVLSQADSPLSYRQLADRIHLHYVRQGNNRSTPFVEGNDLQREFLGHHKVAGRSPLRLKVDEGGRLRLNAGAVHGLTVGSVLAVQSPHAEQQLAQPVGHVRITGLWPLECDVEPCAYAGVEATDSLPDGARARVVYFDHGVRRLRLAIEPPPDSSPARYLATAVRQHSESENSLFQVVDAAEHACWVLKLTADGATLAPVAISSPVDTEDHVEAPSALPVFGPVKTVDELLDQLNRIARVRNLLALAGDERNNASAHLNVEFEMLRLDGAEGGAGEAASRGDSVPRLTAGDWVAFRFKNINDAPVDITLLYFDSQYGITAFFPDPETPEYNRILPGQDVTLERVPITTETVGFEHMLLIASRGDGPPVDYTWLAQPSIEAIRRTSHVRSAAFDSSPANLLRHAAFSQGNTRGSDRRDFSEYCIRAITLRVMARTDGAGTLR